MSETPELDRQQALAIDLTGYEDKVRQHEIFGPVIVVIPTSDERQAVELANDGDFGLNASVFTADPDRAFKAARRLRTGATRHNAFRSDFGIAFCGFKMSGIGWEGRTLGLLPYLKVKTLIFEEESKERFGS